jgi:hypothetical protein
MYTDNYMYIKEGSKNENMVAIVGLQRWTVGGRKGKENDRGWVISKYIASMYEDSITK